jgi:hypothetical protein
MKCYAFVNPHDRPWSTLTITIIPLSTLLGERGIVRGFIFTAKYLSHTMKAVLLLGPSSY